MRGRDSIALASNLSQSMVTPGTAVSSIFPFRGLDKDRASVTAFFESVESQRAVNGGGSYEPDFLDAGAFVNREFDHAVTPGGAG